MRLFADSDWLQEREGVIEVPSLSALRRFYSNVLAEDLPSERVHVMKLPTHDARHRLIGIGVLRDLVGYKTLNTELRVRAAVDKGSHSAN
jgi:hypothetical protein